VNGANGQPIKVPCACESETVPFTRSNVHLSLFRRPA
jgi:hypothetical protein